MLQNYTLAYRALIRFLLGDEVPFFLVGYPQTQSPGVTELPSQSGFSRVAPQDLAQTTASPLRAPSTCSTKLAFFPSLTWITWDRRDPGPCKSLHYAKLHKFPLNPESSPLTLTGLRVTPLNHRSEYNLPYSF